MYTILAMFIIVVCFVYYYITRTFRYWSKRKVNGPKPIPFFGNFKDVALRRQHVGMLYYDLYKQYPEEKVVGLYRMTSPCLLVRDLDVIKQILIKDFEAFPDRGNYFSKEGFTENIFHSEIDTWRILRNRLSPVFTASKLKGRFHLLDRCCDKFIDYIGEATLKHPEQDTYKLCLRYSVDATMCTIFDINMDIYNDDMFQFFLEVDKYFVVTYDRELDMLFPGFVKKLNRTIVTADAIDFCHQVLKIGLNQSSNVTNDLNNIMDVLRSLKKEENVYTAKPDNDKEPFLKITDDLLAAQVWICYIAGYGNSTLTLTYAMYYIACNPEVQDRLINELNQAIEKNDGKFTYEMLKDLKYVEMIFDETLRLHPLTNALQRSAGRATKLEGVDLVIDKGTDIVISPYSIHHDERYFPDPYKFIPDRFSSDNVMNRHPCAFLSFGAGRRSCLGTRLSLLQFGMALTKVVSKFKVETTQNTVNDIKYNATKMLLTPEEKIFLRLLPRQKR